MSLNASNPDNANPIIYKTGGRDGRRRLGDFLDAADDDSSDSDHADFDFSPQSVDDEDGRERMAYSPASSVGDVADVPPYKESAVRNEEIDADEIFDLIRSITDPEHPLTLEQLAVVSAEQIKVVNGPRPVISLQFTPTIPHCSMATLIGLSLRVRLLRALPDRFKVDIRVKEGSHESENSLNKQLNDKERVAAALENNHLLGVVENCLATAGQRGKTPAVV